MHLGLKKKKKKKKRKEKILDYRELCDPPPRSLKG